MSNLSRRQFLKSLGAMAALFVAQRTGFAFFPTGEDFEMLVVGDSLVWGQGLEEKDKFYTLTKNWIEQELGKTVHLKVKAHSGATIFLHEKEAKLLQKGGRSDTQSYYPEVNVSFPTIKTQIELARDEYQKEGKTADSVNLIMLTGGIVDITVAGTLNPFGNDKLLKEQIVQYCHKDMLRFLQFSAEKFPNALFVVVGYFPILSGKTNTARMFNAWLEVYNFPTILKFLSNNILTRPFFKLIQKSGLRRSRIWFDESNRELQNAVTRFNQQTGKQRTVFVKSPLTEAHAFETKETWLFRLEKKDRVNDHFYDERMIECRKTLGELKKSIGLKQSVRQCEIGAIAHPNPDGAKAYAETIKTVLKSVLQAETRTAAP